MLLFDFGDLRASRKCSKRGALLQLFYKTATQYTVMGINGGEEAKRYLEFIKVFMFCIVKGENKFNGSKKENR